MTSIARLESGIRNVPDFPRPGIQFKDITPILADPDLLQLAVAQLAVPFESAGVTKIVAIEARGFILGGALAARLGAGFIPVRKSGKLPYTAHKEKYDLEYGSDAVEMHVDAIGAEDRVLIHDDVIATGGTAAASCALVRRAGANLVGCSFLIELGFLKGRDRLVDCGPIHTVLNY